jgi:hypothetical protein
MATARRAERRGDRRTYVGSLGRTACLWFPQGLSAYRLGDRWSAIADCGEERSGQARSAYSDGPSWNCCRCSYPATSRAGHGFVISQAGSPWGVQPRWAVWDKSGSIVLRGTRERLGRCVVLRGRLGRNEPRRRGHIPSAAPRKLARRSDGGERFPPGQCCSLATSQRSRDVGGRMTNRNDQLVGRGIPQQRALETVDRTRSELPVADRRETP